MMPNIVILSVVQIVYILNIILNGVWCYADNHYSVSRYAECRFAECCYADWHNAKWPNVVWLSVVAP